MRFDKQPISKAYNRGKANIAAEIAEPKSHDLFSAEFMNTSNIHRSGPTSRRADELRKGAGVFAERVL